MGWPNQKLFIAFWLTIGCFLFSSTSGAHVKWFLPVEGEIISAFTPYGLLDASPYPESEMALDDNDYTFKIEYSLKPE